jgi:hypothetical protein
MVHILRGLFGTGRLEQAIMECRKGLWSNLNFRQAVETQGNFG